MLKISVFETNDTLHQKLMDLMDKLLAEKPQINISLSGGSTPAAFFDYWAATKQESSYWQRIRLFWGDERCVSPDDKMSNYGMTRKHLLDKIPIPAGNVFRIIGENDPLQEAERYSALIDNEALPFDLILLGLGEDGHTASIFPSSIDFWDSPRLCIVNAHPDTGQKRISITGQVINNAQWVVFLVTGTNKAPKVQEIVQYPSANCHRYPAAKVQPASGNLLWLMDKDAASLL